MKISADFDIASFLLYSVRLGITGFDNPDSLGDIM